MRAANKPPTDEEVRAIRARWRNRHEMPTTLQELAREYRRCHHTIKRVIVSGGMQVPLRRFESKQARIMAKARAARSVQRNNTDALIAYARQHSNVNRALARIMEVPR